MAIARCWVWTNSKTISQRFRASGALYRRAQSARPRVRALSILVIRAGHCRHATLAATSAQITAKTQPPTATARIILAPFPMACRSGGQAHAPLVIKWRRGFENRLTGSGWAEMVRGTRMRKS